MPDFLLEIGCEEVPARMLDAAANELGKRISELLHQAELGGSTPLNVFATPRRLALVVTGVGSRQADKEEVLQGPATKVAYSDGRPSPAAEAVAIKSASRYQAALEKAHVLVDPAEREKMIRQALDQAARGIPGARWREDKALLNTVVNLTEWPAVILGNFDKEFLALPEEVLVTVMRDHQKYFAVEDSSGDRKSTRLN